MPLHASKPLSGHEMLGTRGHGHRKNHKIAARQNQIEFERAEDFMRWPGVPPGMLTHSDHMHSQGSSVLCERGTNAAQSDYGNRGASNFLRPHLPDLILCPVALLLITRAGVEPFCRCKH